MWRVGRLGVMRKGISLPLAGVRRVGAVGLLGALLSGCALVGNPLVPSDDFSPAMPSAYIHQDPRSEALMRAPAVAPAFWAAFGSPELAALVSRAEGGSKDIAAAIARVRQAEWGALQAGTGLLPSGALSGTSTTFRSSATAAGLESGRLPQQQLRRAGLSASWELDFWGKNAALYSAAARREEAGVFALAATRLAVTAETAQTYVTVLSLRDRLAIARQNLTLARKVMDSIRERVEAGSATQVTLAQQETVVRQQEAAIVSLRRSASQAELSLALLVGTRPGDVSLGKGGLKGLKLPPLTAGLPSDVLSRRPDVRQAEAQILAASQDVGAARAAMLPSLSFSLQRGFESLTTSTLISPASGVANFTSQLTQPLFDAPRLAAQMKGAEARREELIATYEQAVLSSLSDVEKALVALNTSGEELAIAGKAVDAARRAYELTQEQLEAGQVDMTTVLNTQREYFSASDSLEQLRLARFQAAIALYRALGGGWSPEDARLLMQPKETPSASGTKTVAAARAAAAQ